jgi:hypothetical protein
MIQYFIEKGANDWNLGMRCAANKGHSHLVKYFIGEGAAQGGHLDLVKFFIQKGASDYNAGSIGVKFKNHLHLVQFSQSKSSNY